MHVAYVVGDYPSMYWIAARQHTPLDSLAVTFDFQIRKEHEAIQRIEETAKTELGQPNRRSEHQPEQ